MIKQIGHQLKRKKKRNDVFYSMRRINDSFIIISCFDCLDLQMIRYLLIFLLAACVQTQQPTVEKVYKKRFEVNKLEERKFEIYY